MKMAVLNDWSYSLRHFDRFFELSKGLETSKKLSRLGELYLAKRLQGN